MEWDSVTAARARDSSTRGDLQTDRAVNAEERESALSVEGRDGLRNESQEKVASVKAINQD